MTLLSIVQNVADEVGLPAPAFVVNNPDATAQRLLRLANAEGQRLSRRHNWSVLQQEAGFITAAVESQGKMADIAGDFDRFVNETMFNRTTSRRVFGPLGAREWQDAKSRLATAVRDTFRLRQAEVLFHPAPSAGEDIYFEYISRNWALGADDTPKAVMDADTDKALLDEDLLSMGVRWRFLKANGFDYAEEKMEYETQLFDRIAVDGARRTMRLDRVAPRMAGGVALPEGGED